MRIVVLTLFPEMLAAVTEHGITGRAVSNGLLQVTAMNPREFTHDRHRSVDDRPYGGGPGMVMLAEPLTEAIAAAQNEVGGGGRTIYLSPQGAPLTQAKVLELSAMPALVLLAGRYEGVDERVIAGSVDEELSIGDYVVSGGELPALVVIDAVARQLPGVLGHSESAEQDSFANGLLDCPHYTRPVEFGGVEVPQVLLSGDHEKIRLWRLKQALGRTWQRRPDLLQGRTLTDEEQALLAQFRSEQD